MVLVQACGGVVAGGTSALATTPMDTVKTRLQALTAHLTSLHVKPGFPVQFKWSPRVIFCRGL